LTTIQYARGIAFSFNASLLSLYNHLWSLRRRWWRWRDSPIRVVLHIFAVSHFFLDALNDESDKRESQVVTCRFAKLANQRAEAIVELQAEFTALALEDEPHLQCPLSLMIVADSRMQVFFFSQIATSLFCIVLTTLWNRFLDSVEHFSPDSGDMIRGRIS
jgi:hypothetical protein